jgi:7-cyano-7-deazaguanine reductase
LKKGSIMTEKSTLKENPLGKKTTYYEAYDASLLFTISRTVKRDEIGVSKKLPFHGIDIWNNYELSWLNLKGKPEVAIAEFRLPCESPFLIESKSLKLYFNSFNQAKFANSQNIIDTIRKDLSEASQSSVDVRLHKFNNLKKIQLEEFHGYCIDNIEVDINEYVVNPKLLKCGKERVQEELYSNLLKSNCLVTEQPDWGSVYISYQGPKIDHASLLKYIISFRQHNEFHEQCIERIFMDLVRECKTEKLTVFGKYTRRGGLDINPYRSNFQQPTSSFVRTPRQ